MSTFKKWFRGAQDDNPDIEKQEVELAQAIIDLHKVDPVTGEIVDITEDEDKAEEIRKLASMVRDRNQINESNPPESACQTVRLIERLRESADQGGKRIEIHA